MIHQVRVSNVIQFMVSYDLFSLSIVASSSQTKTSYEVERGHESVLDS